MANTSGTVEKMCSKVPSTRRVVSDKGKYLNMEHCGRMRHTKPMDRAANSSNPSRLIQWRRIEKMSEMRTDSNKY